MKEPILIKSTEELIFNVQSFGRWALGKNSASAAKFAASNTYWVRIANEFAPAKCVGYNAASFSDYTAANDYGEAYGIGFNGTLAHKKISQLTGEKFEMNPEHNAELAQWLNRVFGPDGHNGEGKIRKILAFG